MVGHLNEPCQCGSEEIKEMLNLRLWFNFLTAVAVVVHQYDLFEEVGWSPLDDCVDGAQQHWQGLVDKDEDYAELRKVWRVRHVLASERKEEEICFIYFLLSESNPAVWKSPQNAHG